jgi:hypothetical protein
MTPLDWLMERLAGAEEFVRAEYDKGSDFCGPMLVALSGDDKVVVIKLGWNSDDERTQQLTMARMALAMMSAKAYLTISESWFSTALEIPRHGLEFGEISRRLDRQEAVVICGTTIAGENRGKMLQLGRDKKGKVTKFTEPLEQPEFSGGSLMALLHKPGAGRPN